MTTLLSELAALEQSTDPEKREVGARLRTAIRNVLLEVRREMTIMEFFKDFLDIDEPPDWNTYSSSFEWSMPAEEEDLYTRILSDKPNPYNKQ